LFGKLDFYFFRKFFLWVFSAATVAPAKPATGGVTATDRQLATTDLSPDFGQLYPQIPVHK
jgi:hypothetical protein